MYFGSYKIIISVTRAVKFKPSPHATQDIILLNRDYNSNKQKITNDTEHIVSLLVSF